MAELVLGEASIQENFLQDKKEMGDASKTGTTLFSENLKLGIARFLSDKYNVWEDSSDKSSGTSRKTWALSISATLALAM